MALPITPSMSTNADAAQLPLGSTFPSPSTLFESDSSARLIDRLKPLFSFPAMLGTLLVGRVFYEGRAFTVDPDLWWHIKVGQDILRSHRLPTTDPYSWTVHGQPWIAYEWLGEIALALLYRAGGFLALDLFLIAFASVIMLSLYGLATSHSGNSKAGFVAAGLLCSFAFGTFTLRPQMFGYFFLVLTLGILLQFRRGKSWPLWFLPLIFLLWVNTHGSFIIGIGLIALYLISGLFSFQLGSIQSIAWTRKQRLQLECALLLSLAVLSITPYGPQLAAYPFDMAFSQPINVANVAEWKPVAFDLLYGKLFLGIVITFFVVQLLYRFDWQLEDMLLGIGGTALMCLHVRFVMLFVPFFAPLFAAMLARWLPAYDAKKDKYLLNAVLMASAIAAMIYYWPTTSSLTQKTGKRFPIAAVQYLGRNPVSGKLLNNYGYGGYLVLQGVPTFIDGRGDLFERGGVFGDYIHLMQFKPGAFGILKNYGISACLLERDEPLSTALSASPYWKRVYVDQTSALYVRTGDAAGR